MGVSEAESSDEVEMPLLFVAVSIRLSNGPSMRTRPNDRCKEISFSAFLRRVSQDWLHIESKFENAPFWLLLLVSILLLFLSGDSAFCVIDDLISLFFSCIVVLIELTKDFLNKTLPPRSGELIPTLSNFFCCVVMNDDELSESVDAKWRPRSRVKFPSSKRLRLTTSGSLETSRGHMSIIDIPMVLRILESLLCWYNVTFKWLTCRCSGLDTTWNSIGFRTIAWPLSSPTFTSIKVSVATFTSSGLSEISMIKGLFTRPLTTWPSELERLFPTIPCMKPVKVPWRLAEALCAIVWAIPALEGIPVVEGAVSVTISDVPSKFIQGGVLPSPTGDFNFNSSLHSSSFIESIVPNCSSASDPSKDVENRFVLALLGYNRIASFPLNRVGFSLLVIQQFRHTAFIAFTQLWNTTIGIFTNRLVFDDPLP